MTPKNGEPHISGWGRIPVPGREVRSEDLRRATEGAVLTRGLGRSYGDSSLPPPSQREVVATPLADRIVGFDPTGNRLRAEAGLSLREINALFLTSGYCSPVLPGTQFITLGGMVAADVHGKEHHQSGCFGRHVNRLWIRVADGRVVSCDREQHADLFHATIGGMGLTGHILEVELTLRPISSPWILQENIRVPNIDTYIDALKDEGRQWPYTVGWIDCLTGGSRLGRGILMCGRWADSGTAPRQSPRQKLKLTVPFEFPGWALTRPFVRAFNEVYYRKQIRARSSFVSHPETFFHPLDSILNWNRIYGKRGFTQYQCVLPEKAGRAAPRRFLELLTDRGGASFLCVIKDCGPQGDGLLSFPLKGTSIALDLPVRDDTQDVVDQLNEYVIGVGGRIYLAKDSFTRPEHFRRMEPRLDEFLEIRAKWDPKRTIRSAQSVRLFGDPR